jgi:type I restriction enzyme S subunit
MTNSKPQKEQVQGAQQKGQKPAAFAPASRAHALPEGWVEVSLGEVVELIGGGTPKTSKKEYWNGDIPWLSVVDFNNNSRWVSKTEKTITTTGLENSSTKMLDKGNLIISARGTVGELAQLKIPMAFNQSCYGIQEVDTISDIDFLYYLIKYNVQNIGKNVHGAVFDTITRVTFDHIKINLPPLLQQKAIASALSAFDSKIELLREQNETLEKIGETVFKEWFTLKNPHPNPLPEGEGGLPDGWRVGKIEEVVNIKGGGTPSTKNRDFWDGNIHWTSPKDLSGAESIFLFDTAKKITLEGLEKVSSGLLPVDTLLLSSRAPVGYLSISTIEIAINQGYIAILPDGILSNLYMFLWLKINMDIVKNAASGSTFIEISKKVFKELDIVIPELDILRDFDQKIKPLFEKIKNNSEQIQTLAQTRDTLLPRLMKGEVLLSDKK